jgi:hypothetical protein
MAQPTWNKFTLSYYIVDIFELQSACAFNVLKCVGRTSQASNSPAYGRVGLSAPIPQPALQACGISTSIPCAFPPEFIPACHSREGGNGNEKDRALQFPPSWE